MPDPNTPEFQRSAQTDESFDRLLGEYDRNHSRKKESSTNQVEATVIAVSSESVFLDIGYKTEGVLPIAEFQNEGQCIKPGDKLLVAIKGRDPEGYYQLSRFNIARPTDWSGLERAFAEKETIVGTVIGAVKGGLSIDIGVRAFMPASRTGTRDAAEMEKLVGQEIRCRITKLDVADEDVVVDRRVVAEDEARSAKERLYSEIKEGDVVRGEVRSFADYGAFIDLGGVDGLLHVGEIAWHRINKPADVLSLGQQIEAKVIRIESDKHRISLSIKQLQPHPWDSIGERYKTGERVRGVVTRVMDFGAFVELEPGIEGLIHVSEMSWGKKVRKASDLLKPGDNVEVVILSVNTAERRLSLGLKQALGDPWADVAQRLAPGTAIEGPVTSIMNFGAFVQVAEGVEGMIHVSEISAEKRINHPRDLLRVGQTVKAQVLAIDTEKRQLRLSMKQLAPSSLDEYIAEHKEGDLVSGRVTEVLGEEARVELGEGVHASCRFSLKVSNSEGDRQKPTKAQPDLTAMTSMLTSRWKSGSVRGSIGKPEALQVGQIHSFRITALNREAKRIELDVA